ncbi:hypothetical protein BH23VER1_BH23VER1_25050 [soil metagenome]
MTFESNTQPKVGVIGAGTWGRNIIRNFAALGALGAVAERVPALREGVATDHPDVPIFTDHQDLIRSDIDAVAVATPVPSHHAVARDALLAGKDVFVEKPLAFTVAEAEDLVGLAEERGRVLMVGHLLLYEPAIAFVKDFLAAGRIGRVFSLHQERAKLGRVRVAENALWSLGVHDVAVIIDLVGEEVADVAFSSHCCLRSEVADDTYLHLAFPSGISAHVHSSWLWPEDRRRLTVVGEAGMLVYEEAEQRVTLHHKTVDGALQHHDNGSETVFTGSGSGQLLRLELEHFLECIVSRAVPRTSGLDGLAVVRVLEAAGAGYLEPVLT